MLALIRTPIPHSHVGQSPGLCRREFIKAATAAAVAAHLTLGSDATAENTIPSITIGNYRVTRLIAGSNPLCGGSHFNRILSMLMREYFTGERAVQFLRACQRAGVNTWQNSFGERPQRILRLSRKAGCPLNWICLAESWEWDPAKIPADELLAAMMKSAATAAQQKPIGMVYHGEVTDRLWRLEKINQIHGFIDGVHDLGFPAGVSTHNPAVIEALEEKGWPVDFYMGCFYRSSRIPEEFTQEIGVVPVGETYLSTDPERMCKVVRQTSKTCLGFKILAAGRKCDSPQQVRQAFEFAFRNIKPTDGVLVGMFPKFSDQISENVRLVQELAA